MLSRRDLPSSLTLVPLALGLAASTLSAQIVTPTMWPSSGGGALASTPLAILDDLNTDNGLEIAVGEMAIGGAAGHREAARLLTW